MDIPVELRIYVSPYQCKQTQSHASNEACHVNKMPIRIFRCINAPGHATMYIERALRRHRLL